MTQLPLLLVAACALIDPDGRVLIAQRPTGKSMAGLWEFPGGKIEKGERPEDTMIRELQEELGIAVREACLAPFTFASHSYEAFHLLMPLYLCRRWEGTVAPQEAQAIKWVRPRDLADISHAARGFAAYSAAARSHLKAFVRDDSGATAIEYAMIGAIITVGTIAAMTSNRHRQLSASVRQRCPTASIKVSAHPPVAFSRCRARVVFCWLSCGAQPVR